MPPTSGLPFAWYAALRSTTCTPLRTPTRTEGVASRSLKLTKRMGSSPTVRRRAGGGPDNHCELESSGQYTCIHYWLKNEMCVSPPDARVGLSAAASAPR
eukprot:scaffold2150_cov137-Isochrysis_galbana.AAC.12